jgi:sugar-specific transcriptional regulator TrmB
MQGRTRRTPTLGLSEREARVYLEVLRRGSATASETTRAVGLDWVVTYRLLEALRSRGILQVTAQRPRRFVPLPLPELVRRSLDEHRRSLPLCRDEAFAKEFLQQLPTMLLPDTGGLPQLQLLTGESNIYPHLRSAVRRAREEVRILITRRALRQSLRFGLGEELPRLLEAGGSVQVIVEADPRLAPLIDRVRALTRRHPRIEGRSMFPQRARWTLVDRSEVTIFPVPEAGVSQVEEIAWWTNNNDFVRSQLHYFEIEWERAARVRVPPRPRGARRAAPRRRRSGVS